MTEHRALTVDDICGLLAQLDDEVAKGSVRALRTLEPGIVRVWAAEGSEPVGTLRKIYHFRNQNTESGVLGTGRLLEVLEGMPATDRLRFVLADAGDVYVVCFVDIRVVTPYAALLKGTRAGTVP